MVALFKWTVAALANLGVRPSRRLGQNFLVDGKVVAAVISSAGVCAGGSVVEIGPGLGTISEEIIGLGAELFAVELDLRLCEFLRERFATASGFNLKCGDAVRWPVAGLPPGAKDFTVVANLPYGISSPWMDALLGEKSLPRGMTLVVQEDVARRFFATVDRSEVCPISIFLQSAYAKVRMGKLPRSAFYPQPAVESVVLSMAINREPFLFKAATKRAVRKIFTKRRKQIGSIVADECGEVRAWAAESGICQRSRPEEISMEQWQQLDKFF
jgi:16S rRNA (adenine1518-N6/adenine1519-N6)-dimethyltransferase